MTQDQTARSLSKPLLDTNTNNCGHDDTKIIKFAQRKRITKQLAYALNAVCETSAYHRMSRCADTLCKQDDTIVSQYYCQNRLCSVCNTHRSQKYYLQYKDSLASIGDHWYMVTLTIPNVSAHMLRQTIKAMKTTFRSILDTANKRHRRTTGTAYFHGILATECTYSLPRNDFHPHFHVLVHGEDCADHLMFEWLRHNDTATIEAQNTKPISGLDASLREIFKYSIKGADADTPPQAVHIMAQAFKHLRSIQPFGSVKAKKLDQDQDTPEAVTGDKVKFDATKPYIVYKWYNMNWYDRSGNGLIPDDRMQYSRKALNTIASMTKTTLRIYRKPQAKYERL
jgi:plasmid rolling circle replication initiator protein Rep